MQCVLKFQIFGPTKNKMMQINEKIILKKIRKTKKENNKICIIAIDGITCSGKSLYADLLKKRLKKYYKDIFVLSKDLFLISRKKRIKVTNKIGKKFSGEQNKLHYDRRKLDKLISVLKQKNKSSIRLKGLYNRKNGKNDKNLYFDFKKNSVIIFEGLFILDDLKKIKPIYKILVTNNVYNSLARKIERIRDKKISIQKVVTEFTNLHLKSMRNYLIKNDFNESYSGEETKFMKIKNGKSKQINLINIFFKKHLF